jgi:hypothetical protein
MISRLCGLEEAPMVRPQARQRVEVRVGNWVRTNLGDKSDIELFTDKYPTNEGSLAQGMMPSQESRMQREEAQACAPVRREGEWWGPVNNHVGGIDAEKAVIPRAIETPHGDRYRAVFRPDVNGEHLEDEVSDDECRELTITGFRDIPLEP